MGPDDLRVFVAAPRSGSTLFMRIMANCPDVAVTSRNVLMGNAPKGGTSGKHRDFTPDYRIFSDPEHPIYQQAEEMGCRLIVSKEEFGNSRLVGTYDVNECNYDIFPSDEALDRARPVFTVRDPYSMMDSWLARGWDDHASFVTAYRALLETLDRARDIRPDTIFYTYDYITEDVAQQHAVFQAICNQWGVPFSPEMLVFTEPFGQNFVYATERERNIYTRDNPKEIFTTLMASDGIIPNVPGHGLIKPHDIDVIERNGLHEDYRAIDDETRKRFAPDLDSGIELGFGA